MIQKMSLKYMFNIKLSYSFKKTAFLVIVFMGFVNYASAGKFAKSQSDFSSYSSLSGASKIMLDLQMHYVRDTKPVGNSESAAKLSIGGQFTNWVGLDLFGMVGSKSKNSLVGADLRLMPSEWLFLKGGFGAYSDRKTGQLKGTPMAGTGIMAFIDQNLYFLSEFTYFQVSEANNVSFGAGLGLKF